LTTESPRAPTRYRSKVDWWLGLILVAVPIVTLASAVALQASDDPEAIYAWIACLAVAAIYVGLLWPVEYELGPSELVIRFGLIRSRVPYAAIRGIVPTRNPLSAPALSLDRLAIDVGGQWPRLISPADRDGFLDGLAARAPHLIRAGDGLEPR
jgi:hypothetical protein